jgi:cobalt/nickel transport system permease protein
VLMMQPIHLAIGIVEGIVTAAVVIFVWNARPEILNAAVRSNPIGQISIKKVIIGLLAASVIIGGALSWFASANPDGLEWAMFKTAGVEELENKNGLHESLSALQKKTAILPDYGFKKDETQAIPKTASEPAWPAVDPGTSLSGIVGGGLTLVVIVLIGFLLRRRKVN